MESLHLFYYDKENYIMKIVNNVDIVLYKPDLEVLIKEQLSKEGYEVNPKDISFEVATTYEGFGAGEHKVCRFDKCIVKNAKIKEK